MLSLGGLWLLSTIPNYETYWTACTAGKKISELPVFAKTEKQIYRHKNGHLSVPY